MQDSPVLTMRRSIAGAGESFYKVGCVRKCKHFLTMSLNDAMRHGTRYMRGAAKQFLLSRVVCLRLTRKMKHANLFNFDLDLHA